MVDPHLHCKECDSCSSGHDHLCNKLAFIGCSGGSCGGGLSEFVAVSAEHVYPLPSNVSLEFAALIEPLVVGHHAVRQAAVDLKGKTVLILGAGPIGLALIFNLMACDTKQILLSEPTAQRSALAKTLVQKVINPKLDDVGEVCRQLTNGKGVDVVFDCAGVQAALNAGIEALRSGGIYVNIAQWEKSVRFKVLVIYHVSDDPQFHVNFRSFFIKEIKIVSSCCYNNRDWREVMKLMSEGNSIILLSCAFANTFEMLFLVTKGW